MRTVETIAALRDELRGARAGGASVGFVPTMGALHRGHMSLVALARAERDVVVVSIFVNPAQFGPNEDFAAYPRNLEGDLELLRGAGADLVFTPSRDEMYPAAAVTRVVVDGLTARMEGAMRPGHFEGVAIVVAKLFSIVGECTAYFGEKDAQQLRVVRRMSADLNLPVEVVGCPTVRDEDGLALSSRNAYLSGDERGRALALPRALQAVAARAADERDVAALLAAGRAVVEDGPDSVDYLECVDPETLEAVERLDGPALLAGAVRVGRTRLIDNVTIAPGSDGA